MVLRVDPLLIRTTVLAACVVHAAPAAAQTTRQWRPEERVVVSDFSVVRAVAAGHSQVFVATENGLGIYDWQVRRWDPPVGFDEGYPREPVRVAVVDPTDESVWMGTASGLVRYRHVFRQFERILVPGGVQDLVYDRTDPYRGIHVRTSSGWEFLPSGAFVPQRGVPPPPLGRRVGSLGIEELFARQPALDAMRATLLLDERLRTFRYTSAAVVPITEEYYVGTDGVGVIRVEGLGARAEPLAFGLLARGVGAVLSVPGGVWVGTDHFSRRAGLTFVGDGLQRYVYREGPPATGLGITGVRALLGRGDEIWAGTDRGVIRFAPDGETRPITAIAGFPDAETFALAQGPSGVWIGTAYGLAFAPNGEEARRVGNGPRVPVLALSAARDTVWVGTTDGLGIATPGGDLLVPGHVAAVPDLRAAIVAIAHAADTLVVATIDRIMWRAPDGDWQIERVIGGELGAVLALAADVGGVWIGGDGGIGFFRFASREYRFYRAPGDVPGRVRGLVVAGAYLWVATDAGLARFARRALVP